MKEYKILVLGNPTLHKFEEALNEYAKEGFTVKFLAQSEDEHTVHHTVLLEREKVEECDNAIA